MAGHLYSTAATLVIQLASLPIFLTRWSTEQYGYWVMISTIPTYLTLADAGILTASGNMMSMHRARDEMTQLTSVFKCSLFVMLVLVPSVAVIVGALLRVFDFGLSSDQRLALFYLCLAVLLTIASDLFDAAYRPFGKYPRVIIYLTSARLFEWACTIAGLFWVGTLAGAALGLLAGRAVAFAALLMLAQRDLPELPWTLRGVDFHLASRIVRSGLGFLILTIGSLMSLQGMVVLVGAQLGGKAVAVFSASRTLTRLLSQLAIITGKSMAPEISALYGAGRDGEADQLNHRLVLIVIPLTVLGAVFLALAGPAILDYWSHGKILFDRPVFMFLLLAAVTTSFWQLRAVRLTASNRHRHLAIFFFFVSCLSLIAVFLTQRTYGVSSPAAATFFTDLAMLFGTTVFIRRAHTA